MAIWKGSMDGGTRDNSPEGVLHMASSLHTYMRLDLPLHIRSPVTSFPFIPLFMVKSIQYSP